ncbi:SCO6880 family protein [Spirillospora sp. NBC_01491]|uniref:SCO6880 family protein n=1 Tax=Spirillospora sp. NBC_01491 TaxID=2976007 RepID=UPI002E348217|nr:SCO6880 family protein [Spirillospora sp. NBC_01491]
MASDYREPTYGNWRKPVSPGIGRLGLAGTLILMVGLIIITLVAMASVKASLVAVVVLGVVMLPLVIQDQHGRTALQSLTARFNWWSGRSQGWHLYRSGPLSVIPHGSCRLPGLLAQSRLVEGHDSYGRPFALIIVPAAKHYTVVFDCNAEGAGLVDQSQVDTWVSHWGHWLASLSYEPGLVAASVTIETAPDSGTRLREEIHGNIDPHAPELARAALEEIVWNYPVGSARVATRIAVTYAALPQIGGRRRDQEAMVREIGMRIPGLISGLAMTGAGSARPMTADQLARAVRIAYDPDAQSSMEAAGDTKMRWEDVGPVASQESWDHYVHDSGHSITWGMSEAPRGEVLSNVMSGLVAPHHDIARKRVTFLYRPHDPASASRIVERDRRDSRFRLDGSASAARNEIDVIKSDQSALEEARGAGVTRFTILVTATVPSAADLPIAAAAVDTLSAPARLRLRRMYGAQASAFAAGLPLGIVLPSHIQVPSLVRESL